MKLQPDGEIIAGANPAHIHAQENAPRGNPERVIGRSDLVKILENPRKWRFGIEEGQTAPMRLGGALDCLVTQPEAFASQFAVEPDTYPAAPARKGEASIHKPWTYQATFCKAWREEVRGRGLVEISPKEHSKAVSMAGELRDDLDIYDLIQCSRAQVLVRTRYTDRATGITIPLRCIIDLVPDPSHERYGDCLADLKTAADGSPRGWERAIAAHGYHVQGALYRDAINAHGFEYRQFLHPVVESEGPHVVSRRMLSDDWLANGEIEYQRALTKYCECLSRNVWPGYDDQYNDMMRPLVNGWRIAQMPAYLAKEAA